MKLRTTKRILWLSTGACVIASMAVIAWAVTSPPTLPKTSSLSVNEISAHTQVHETSDLTRQQLTQLANIPLSRPLVDPGTKHIPTHHEPNPSAHLPVRLIGVAIENDRSHSMGLFAIGNQIHFCQAGEVVKSSAGPITVNSVTAKDATVHFQGKSYTLKLIKSKAH